MPGVSRKTPGGSIPGLRKLLATVSRRRECRAASYMLAVAPGVKSCGARGDWRRHVAGRPAQEILLGDDAGEPPAVVDDGQASDLGRQHALACGGGWLAGAGDGE